MTPHQDDERAAAKNCTGSHDGDFDPDCKRCQGFLAGASHGRKSERERVKILVEALKQLIKCRDEEIRAHYIRRNQSEQGRIMSENDGSLRLAREALSKYLDGGKG